MDKTNLRLKYHAMFFSKISRSIIFHKTPKTLFIENNGYVVYEKHTISVRDSSNQSNVKENLVIKLMSIYICLLITMFELFLFTNK
uniref:Uncharacterized protein n=1 Tax=Triticum urartu TaxID=4572 RepID=A0A8R7U949_TRIUA